jgi:hypothetical protein
MPVTTLASLAGRFKSGNSIEVERIHITRKEYDAICEEHERLRLVAEEVANEIDEDSQGVDAGTLAYWKHRLSEVTRIVDLSTAPELIPGTHDAIARLTINKGKQ